MGRGRGCWSSGTWSTSTRASSSWSTSTRASASRQVSPDGFWYWDGRRWVPLRKHRPEPRRATRDAPISLLLFLLILDLAGFAPGALAASAVAAVVLLVIDTRGLLSLNGLIPWRRMTFRLRVLVLGLEVVFFQFVVLIYIAQRLLGMAMGGVRPAGVDRAEVHAVPETQLDAVVSVAPLDAESIQTALNALVTEANQQLPREDLLEKVHAVAAAIGDVLPAYRASNLSQEDRFVVERTAVDYLPSALHAYLKLPVPYRSGPLAGAEGKTGDELLSDQLDLLIQRMRQVVDTAYQKDVEALLVHSRFLRSKFGQSDLRLNSD